MAKITDSDLRRFRSLGLIPAKSSKEVRGVSEQRLRQIKSSLNILDTLENERAARLKRLEDIDANLNKFSPTIFHVGSGLTLTESSSFDRGRDLLEQEAEMELSKIEKLEKQINKEKLSLGKLSIK